jgi:biopolymer transport protein TolR
MGICNGASSGKAACEINVTPLIDVLLVLRIIFMVIVPVTAKGLNALVPQPPKPNPTPAPDNIVVQILAAGSGEPSYRINQTGVPKSQLEPQLAAILATRQQKVMFIKADNFI